MRPVRRSMPVARLRTRRDSPGSEARRRCGAYSSPSSASRPGHTATGSSRPGEPLQLLQRGALDVVAQQLAVLADGPHGGTRHLDVLLIRRRACEAVVLTSQPPTGGDAAAVSVLERLQDLEMEIVDRRQEAFDPFLEVLAAGDGFAARTDDEVIDHESVDRPRVMGVPHLLPEGVHNVDGIVHVACNASRSADNPRSIASVAAGTTPAYPR